jgi:hypothetical protein
MRLMKPVSCKCAESWRSKVRTLCRLGVDSGG